MAIIAKFYVGDKAYNVLQADYGFGQHSDETGRPTNYRSAFKGLTMMIESTHDNYFFDMATHPTKKDQGKLVFTDAVTGGRSRTLYFADFVVIGHKTGFTANDSNPMIETVSISAGGIKDSVSGTSFSNHWQETGFPTSSPPTVTTEEERPKKCRIEFKASNSDLRDGLFGFDAYSTSLDRNCLSNGIAGRTVTYKDSYRSIQVEGEDYRVPKMTLRINRIITLDLDKDLHREEEYNDISFTTPAGFTITPVDNRGNPVDLVEAKKVQITCTTHGDPDTPTTIQVLADGTVAGAIDIRHSEPKTITVKTVILEAKGGRIDNDVSRLVNKTTREKLEEYFKAVLDPALIDVELVDDTPEVFDLTTIAADDQMGQHYLKKIQETMTEGSTHSVKFTEQDKDDFFNNLGQLYIAKRTNAGQPYDRSQLLLIFTNMKCMKTTQEGKNQYSNGITKSGISMMFMANNDIRPHQEIPHEIMHGAGLPHPFKETIEKDQAKTHIFKQGSTDNYMDYDNEAKRKHLWHWQWDKLYNSRYAE